MSINPSHGVSVLQAIHSQLQIKPQRIVSCWQKLVSVTNCIFNSANLRPKEIEPVTVQQRQPCRVAPQPTMAMKLRLALEDFKQDPVMARKKWLGDALPRAAEALSCNRVEAGSVKDDPAIACQPTPTKHNEPSSPPAANKTKVTRPGAGINQGYMDELAARLASRRIEDTPAQEASEIACRPAAAKQEAPPRSPTPPVAVPPPRPALNNTKMNLVAAFDMDELKKALSARARKQQVEQ